jgi:BirA family transcriptional regulator, biotin operon repressor / biotin---[acetyl-CoA-carboxylase] ligase
VIDFRSAPAWLHWLASCPSTNTWALTHRQTLEHGMVVFTPNQTAGRGQAGRAWVAPPGVLTASFILDLTAPQLPGLSLRVGLAVIQAVERLVPNPKGRLRLKWPNDILVGQRKLAGILCEATSSQSAPIRVVVGIGMNLQVNFQDLSGNFQAAPEQPGLPLAETAISLHQITPQVPTDLELLTSLRHELMTLSQTCLEDCFPQLQARDALYGARLTFAPSDELPPLRGLGAGFGPKGQLLIRLESGEVKAVASGRVLQWQPAERYG